MHSQKRVAILPRLARIDRVDAGPAAIALTPHQGGEAALKASGLEEKDGRWLLKERIGEGDRTARIIALLEDVASAA